MQESQKHSFCYDYNDAVVSALCIMCCIMCIMLCIILHHDIFFLCLRSISVLKQINPEWAAAA